MEITNDWAEDSDVQTEEQAESQTEDAQESDDIEDPGYDDTQESDEISVHKDEDETFWERIRIIGELREAKQLLEESSAALIRLKDEAKEEKENASVWQSKINKLLDQLFMLESPVNPNGLTTAEMPTDASTPVATRDRGIVDAEQPDDETWRQIPTMEVISGISGIGAKKRQALIDIMPTLGDLQDARIEASNEFVPFKLKLPSGFGDATADQIEDKVCEIVCKYSSKKEHSE